MITHRAPWLERTAALNDDVGNGALAEWRRVRVLFVQRDIQDARAAQPALE